MTLDGCVYALADLLEETMDHNEALCRLENVLSDENFSMDEVVTQFTTDYVCTPEVYVKNIFDDDEFTLD